MAQVFNPVSASKPNPILCYYSNTTRLIQIIRIANIPNWYFEQVIFPGQRLFFEAFPRAQLEIYNSRRGVLSFASVIPCRQLRVQELNSPVESVKVHSA